MLTSLRYLTNDDERLLLEKAERLRFGGGDVVIEEESREQALFFLRSGTVRVERDYLGTPVPIAVLEAGEIFGEISFVDAAGASATVIAAGSIQVDKVRGDHVEALLISVPGLAARFYKSLAVTLSERLRETSGQLMPAFPWG